LIEEASRLLQEGLQLHRQGALDEAMRCYVDVLKVDPRSAQAHYYLSTLACQQGRFSQGAELAQKAIELDGSDSRAHNMLGTALHRMGRHTEALAAFTRAIELQPESAPAHGRRADTLVALGRLAEAVEAYDAALALDPTALPDLMNRGAALIDLDRIDDAVAHYARVVALHPQFPGGYFNRGNAYLKLSRFEDALSDFDRALALDPDNADVLNNRANALRRLDREKEAFDALDRALTLDPNHNEALATRANLLVKNLRYREALVTSEKVLGQHPDHLNALISRSDALAGLDRIEEALEACDRVLAIDPGRTLIQRNKGILLLGLGRLSEGWPLFESRWVVDGARQFRPYPQPRFDGNRCDGTVLVWGEQGLGDHMLHAGLIEELAERANSVVFEVESRLVPLFARSFPRVKIVGVGTGEAPPLYSGPVDTQIPLASLGGIFRPSMDAFRRRSDGYLKADPTHARALRKRLAHDGRKLIGLSWRSVAPTVGASKTIALREFEPLLRMQGCRFVDLQYGDTREERTQVERELGIRVEHVDDIDNTNDIDGLAALIAACDVVATVSNTTAHLAGALGASTWVLVPGGHARMWYWFRDRAESPWYPRVRIKRQASGEPWSALIMKTADEISAMRAP
jgi:tetratricopeptide (TPR) repeat protein